MIHLYALLSLLLLFFLNSPSLADSCKTCHRGIEPIANGPVMKALECSFCHKGNPDAPSKELAHRGIWKNPAAFEVADKTCGMCHREILERSKKSFHATSAGIISATRYLFAAQKTKNALYAVRPVRDTDGDVPIQKGAVKSLKMLPTYDPSLPESPQNTPADDYLREECLRCHLYSYGANRFGDYRSSGCAACHMIYDDDGTYKGKDEAISTKSPGPKPVPRPRLHRLTVKIPPFQCIHCHNRGGRTGVSYIGTMESDGYGSPWGKRPGEKGGKKTHGKYYNHLQPDIHFEKGLYCIDCHTENDLHGDGNIYSKKEQAVEIECQDCHGTTHETSRLKTSWGNPLPRLKLQDGKVWLVSATGKRHLVPQVKDVIEKGSADAKNAMTITAHMKRLECYACHSRWAPQCYGCHAQQDTSTKSFDWLNPLETADPSQAGLAKNRAKTAYKWRETRSFLRWEDPGLGINSEGLVSPFIPGCQVIFTQIGPDGKCRVHNKVYNTTDGFYAIATNPIQPHTVSKKARSCEGCHASTKALGLGQDIYITSSNGVNIPFSLEKFVDINGTQLQATSHYGARPFNKEELKRIMRVNTCAACHGWKSPIFSKNSSKGLKAPDNPTHRAVIRKILEADPTIRRKNQGQ